MLTKIADYALVKYKEADYILALKGNQGNLHEDVKLFLDDSKENNFKDVSFDFHKTIDGDHGRIEKRRYWTTSDTDWLHEKGNWKNRNCSKSWGISLFSHGFHGLVHLKPFKSFISEVICVICGLCEVCY